MNDFLNKIIARAKENPKLIAFPEANNIEILKTAEKVVETGIGFPYLIGDKTVIESISKSNNVSTIGFNYFNNMDELELDSLVKAYIEQKDDLSEKAIKRKAKDPIKCALLLLKIGKVDCVAAGKEYTTGDVIFDSMSIVGLQDGVESVSSLGIAEIPGYHGSEGELLALSDCAINAQPDENDLAGIAIASADTVSVLLGWEPRVAMLAYSTDGSADHDSIDTIREAIKKVRSIRPDIKIDGEFQLDSALIDTVSVKKVKRESEVAGKANILVFPNLHAGNIGVKMIQIFGKANAYGPILQGFALPICDFSRSAPVEEMLGNVAMLVIRANSAKGKNEY